MSPQDKQPPGGIGQTILGDTAARERTALTFVELADRSDEEKAALRALVEPVIIAARLLLSDGYRRTAAGLFDWVAAKFRGRSFIALAEDYERQAKECRKRKGTSK